MDFVCWHSFEVRGFWNFLRGYRAASRGGRSDAAHRAHERLVDLIAAGATQDAEELWRRHLAAGDVELLADPEVNSVLDLLD